MTDYVEHVTSAGERWDQIADRYYGDPYGYERIIAANPLIPIVPILGAGARLVIPVLDPEVSSSLTADLPPWKQPL